MEIVHAGIVVETLTLTIVGVVPHVEMTVMTEVLGVGVKHVTIPNTKQELAEVPVDLEVPVEPVVTAVKDKEIIGQQNLVAVEPVVIADLEDLAVVIMEATLDKVVLEEQVDKVVLEEPEETEGHLETVAHLETLELQVTKEPQETQVLTETMVMVLEDLEDHQDLEDLEDLAVDLLDITSITAVT